MPIDFTTSQWSDISTPPALLEDTLAPISYAPAYELLLRYFFHLNKANERSERMLELTTEILQKNPGHYTIWMARVECLMKMQIEQLRQNLTWLNTLLQDNPKVDSFGNEGGKAKLKNGYSGIPSMASP